MRVGSAAHTHVERFTCVSRGLRAHSRVTLRAHNSCCFTRTPARSSDACAAERPGPHQGIHAYPSTFLSMQARAVCTLGLPKTQTTSPQTALFRRFLPRWSAFWAPRPSDSLRGGGNCAMQGCDTPATRRHSASHGAKPPHHPQRRAPRHPTGKLGRQGTAAECDTNSQWSGPTVSLRRLGATAGPEATS